MLEPAMVYHEIGPLCENYLSYVVTTLKRLTQLVPHLCLHLGDDDELGVSFTRLNRFQMASVDDNQLKC